MAGYILSRQADGVGDAAGALRWASLTYLADKLGGHPGVGGAQAILTHGIGLGEAEIGLLDRLADTARSKGDWKDAGAFPEMCLTMAINDPDGGNLVAASNALEHPVSAPFLNRALVWALDKPQDPDTKGKRLERITAYLTGTLAGARSRIGFNSLDFECEQDVTVNQRSGTRQTLPGGSTSMLVECKNWKDPVRAPEVGYFLARMQFVGVSLGLLVAKSGITGAAADASEKNARSLLRGLCQRENIACLVLTRADLESVVQTRSFRGLLESKYEEFTFGRQRRHT
jgi:hypothetical protein